MACCEPELKPTAPPGYRRVLVAVLAINMVMFLVEAAAGWMTGSRALRADALDFLGDAATYGLTLWAISQSFAWRIRAARIKGVSLLVLGLLVLADSVVAMITGVTPEAPVMGLVGLVALTANLISLALLFRYRDGDANIRSVWLCSRNDVIANLSVIAAGALVWVSGSRWPDLVVAVVIAVLFSHSAVSIFRQANRESPAPD
tara:strand:+ start:8121 stop:8729 length:609 start_codon:yes stop_codon:yes gene_type:complete